VFLVGNGKERRPPAAGPCCKLGSADVWRGNRVVAIPPPPDPAIRHCASACAICKAR
jgi:hypothetical protein